MRYQNSAPKQKKSQNTEWEGTIWLSSLNSQGGLEHVQLYTKEKEKTFYLLNSSFFLFYQLKSLSTLNWAIFTLCLPNLLHLSFFVLVW